MQIKIDGKLYDFRKGESVLEVCRRNKIKIPTLCYHQDLLPGEGVCRLCLVKTSDSGDRIVTSCQTEAKEGLEVITNDGDIEKGRRINLELLWADHFGKCAKCKKNGNCELQNLARDFKIDVDDFIPTLDAFEKEEQLRLLKESLKNRVVDDGNPSIHRDNQYCVECKRCIKVCKNIQTIETYSMNHRSIETKVGTAREDPMDCIFCGQCANYCPTAAITEKDEVEKLEKILQDNGKMKIFQVDPEVLITLGEGFGLFKDDSVENKIPTALKKFGADFVFNGAFFNDIMIIEEANNLVEKIIKIQKGETGNLPIFSSYCSSWRLYVEKYQPKLESYLSNIKSPQQIFGALTKDYFSRIKKINKKRITTISITGCSSRKKEAEKDLNVDLVVTVRELVRFLKKRRVKLENLEDGKFDHPFAEHSGSGILPSLSGGLAEGVARTVYEQMTGEELSSVEFSDFRKVDGFKEVDFVIPKKGKNKKEIKIRFGIASEIRNAKRIIEKVKDDKEACHFIEIMACSGGCINGGGQPINVDLESDEKKKRKESVCERDQKSTNKKSHENEDAKKLYEEFLGKPGSRKTEKVLQNKN